MKEWRQLQRELYQNTLKEVRLYLGRQPKALERYARQAKTDPRDLRVSDSQQLFEHLNRSDIVFFGDFHPLRQSQRLLIRLLREKRLKPPRVLALEVLEPKFENLVRQWQKSPSQKNEAELLRTLELDKRWGASLETYKELFRLCHSLKIEIKGLGLRSTLIKRDAFAAKIIQKTQTPIWILFGEHHCARNHIPRLVHHSRPDSSILVVQQNDDEASLKFLNKHQLTKPMVLRAADWTPRTRSKNAEPIRLFHILHTPLWVKWQSFLERQLKGFSEEDLLGEDVGDPQNQISWSVQTLMHFLEDPRYPNTTKKKDVLDFTVILEGDRLFYRSLVHFSKTSKQKALRQLQDSGIFVDLEKRRIFLTELTLNACAQAAGAYLYEVWSQYNIERSGFYQQTLQEAMSYFLSKLLNHSRRAKSLAEWAKISRSKDERVAKAFVQSLKLLESFEDAKIIQSIRPFMSSISVSLGRALADVAFEAFLAGEFSRGRLIRLISHKVKSEHEAFQILVELRSVGEPFQPHRSKLW